MALGVGAAIVGLGERLGVGDGLGVGVALGVGEGLADVEGVTDVAGVADVGAGAATGALPEPDVPEPDAGASCVAMGFGGTVACPDATDDGSVTVTPSLAVACVVPFDAVIVKDWDTVAVGLPDNSPVDASKVSPAGAAGESEYVTAGEEGNPLGLIGVDASGEPMVPVTFWVEGERTSGVAGDAGVVIDTLRSALVSVLLPLIVTL